jgi:hypothetical protein
MMNAILAANTDVGLGVVIGVLSAIPVAAFIYVAESERFSGFRLKLSKRQEHSRPGRDHASVTKPNSAAEASIGLFGSTRTV